MSRVVVPHTSLRPEVRAALEADGIDAVYRETPAGDPEALWQVLRQAWATGETFAVVEHDIVPPPGGVSGMLACPEQWCGFLIPDKSGGMCVGIGCTKFSRSLIERHPGLIEGLRSREWQMLDSLIDWALVVERGEPRPHLHWPMVGHLKPGIDPEYGWGSCGVCGRALAERDIRPGPGRVSCADGHLTDFWGGSNWDSLLGRTR